MPRVYVRKKQPLYTDNDFTQALNFIRDNKVRNSSSCCWTVSYSYSNSLCSFIRSLWWKPDLPPFELSKAENHFQKAEIDRSFIVRKQKICFWDKTMFKFWFSVVILKIADILRFSTVISTSVLSSSSVNCSASVILLIILINDVRQTNAKRWFV